MGGSIPCTVHGLLGGILLSHLCLLRFAGLTARGGLKTCTESPMSTEVWEDYVKLGDLKRPPVAGQPSILIGFVFALVAPSCKEAPTAHEDVLGDVSSSPI